MNQKFTIFFLFFLSMGLLTSCDLDPDDEVLPVIGVYDGHVIGLSGPFSVSIAADGGDDIVIDAPFDGFNYVLVEADTDDDGDGYIDIDIDRQFIDDVSELWGDGFFFDGSIQLDYSIRVGNTILDYQLIATKY